MQNFVPLGCRGISSPLHSQQKIINIIERCRKRGLWSNKAKASVLQPIAYFVLNPSAKVER
jgi:hypothetical protein